MSIKAGTADVNKIYVGTTPVKAVYAGDTKVWPLGVPIPDAPNHRWAGRVIYNRGVPHTSGTYYTERGDPIPAANMKTGDIHIMVAGQRGGVNTYNNIYDYNYENPRLSAGFKAGAVFFSDATKLGIRFSVTAEDVNDPVHFIKDTANTTYYPSDFSAYAWTFSADSLGDPDGTTLSSSAADIGKPINITSGLPYGVALVVYGAMSIENANISLSGLIHTQGGASPMNRYKMYGGYRYVRLDENGAYYEADDNSVDATKGYSERLFVYRRRT